MDIDYFRKIQNTYNSDSKKNPLLYTLKKQFNDSFDKSTDYEQFTTFNGILKESLVIKTTKDNEKIVKVRPDDTFKTGQIVECYNNNWLITSIDPKQEFITTGKMIECNWTFKWQNPTTKEIITRNSVVLNASQYNSGVEGNKTITIGSNQYMIYLPLDSETLLLTYDMRVFIDNNYKIPYKLTRPDNVSNVYNNEGILILIATQDQLNLTTDRPDLGLCDYITPTILSTAITYAGKPEISIGRYKTFTAVTELAVTWNLILSSAQTDNVNMTITNNKVKINILNKELLIGTSFKIVATVDGISNELLITIVGGV